jgi:hypothetical protein
VSLTQRIWTADEEGARVLVRIVMEWPKNWGKPTYNRLLKRSEMDDSTFDRGRKEAVKGRKWLTGGGKGGYRLSEDGCWKEALVEAPGQCLRETEGDSSTVLLDEALTLSHDLAELLKKV